MRRRRFLLPALLLSGLLAGATSPARAVILYRTGDPAANTTAPTGALLDSGWQFQGRFGRFLGTPFAPNLFLTAEHFGNEAGLGTPFVFGGVTYPTVAVYDDPGSDLRVVRVDGVFPVFAPLLTRLDPVDEPLVVFGRGTQRGDAVNVPANSTNLAGWRWGDHDPVTLENPDGPRQRWGTNVVAQTFDNGPFFGRLIRATFDAAAGPDEAHLSDGDSGGAVFLRDRDGVWKLAGINFAVDGPHSYTASGASGFTAALFATDGLFEGGAPASGPTAFYATEIAARLDFLRLVLGEVPLARLGGDVLFGFASESGKNYRVEFRNDLGAGDWETVPGAANVAGNGYWKLVTDPGAAGQPRRFYRAVALP